MWRFKPGYLGACIVAVAILGGILAGSLLNISSHNETTTTYEYTTDITGLFKVTNEPQYIEYNPATNYTGYTATDTDATTPSGLEYSTTAGGNYYRMVQTIGTTSAGPSGTVDNSTTLTQSAFSKPLRGEHVGPTAGGGGPYIETWYSGFKIANMFTWATATFGDLNQYSKIVFYPTWPTQGAPGTQAPIMAVTTEYNDYIRVAGPSDYNDRVHTSKVEIDPQALTITRTFYQGAGLIYGPFTTTQPLQDCYIYYGDCVQNQKTSGGVITSYPTSLSFSYTSEVTTVDQYNYMLPANGVSLYNTTPTVWDNDTTATLYDNYRVNIVIGPQFDDETGQYITTYPDNPHNIRFSLTRAGGADTVDITHANAGPAGWKLSYNGGEYLTAGNFPAIMLTIEKAPLNTDGQTIKVYPIVNFEDYQTVQVGPDPVITLAGSVYDLDNITISDYNPTSAPGTAPFMSWSVYSTYIFMNTYDAVLVNPSINLADYWPDMTSYRYGFQSFAIYGDSVTLNGVNYPITDGKITIGEKTYNFDNVYISYSIQGTTNLYFKNVNKTVDLGPTVDKTVSFYGVWYFTTGLYEGHSDTVKIYDWNVKLLGDSLNTIVLLSLGFILLLALLCVWLKGVSVSLTDKLVMGAGALILVLFLVV